MSFNFVFEAIEFLKCENQTLNYITDNQNKPIQNITKIKQSFMLLIISTQSSY